MVRIFGPVFYCSLSEALEILIHPRTGLVIERMRFLGLYMVPGSVLALGWAGVLPIFALTDLSVLGPLPSASAALDLLLLYGAVILAFMGGVQWDLEMDRQGVTGSVMAQACCRP